MYTFLINGSYMVVIRFLFQIQVTDIDLSIVLIVLYLLYYKIRISDIIYIYYKNIYYVIILYYISERACS